MSPSGLPIGDWKDRNYLVCIAKLVSEMFSEHRMLQQTGSTNRISIPDWRGFHISSAPSSPYLVSSVIWLLFLTWNWTVRPLEVSSVLPTSSDSVEWTLPVVAVVTPTNGSNRVQILKSLAIPGLLKSIISVSLSTLFLSLLFSSLTNASAVILLIDSTASRGASGWQHSLTPKGYKRNNTR